MIRKHELKNFRHHIRMLEREIAFQQKDDTSCCGVSLTHCYAMMEMADCGEISVTELAENLDLDKSTLSRTVESMVASGMVERTADGADRRRAILKVTDEGRSTIERVNGYCDDYYKKLFKLISREKQGVIFEAIELLATAMKKLRAAEAAGGGKKRKSSCCG